MKTRFALFFLLVIVFSCKKKDLGTQGPNDVWLLYKRFNPTSLEIKKGTTITFTNQDNADHTVTETKNVFASGKIKSGNNFQYTFNDSATYYVYCNYHPDNLQEQIYISVK